MKYPVIVVPFLSADAMALFPFILVKQKSFKDDKVLIRHETIHLKQELELLIIPFYVFYLINYLVNLVRYSNRHKAYMNIVFEREAYRCEHKTNYLKERKLWAWMSHL